MADFGAHRYYKVVIDSAVGTGSWNLSILMPMLHGSPVGDPLNSYISYSDIQKASRMGISATEVVGYDTVLYTAGEQYASWLLLVKRTITDFGDVGWYTSIVGSAVYGTFEFPSPLYLPVWYIQAGSVSTTKVSGITFYYSDDGTVWTSIKSFTDAADILKGRRDSNVFYIGDYYVTKHITASSNIPSIDVRHKAVTVATSIVDIFLTKGLMNLSAVPSSPQSDTYATLANISWRYSGGVSNSTPTLSVGGPISSAEAISQYIYSMDTMTGVSILTGSSNARGVGSIYLYTDSTGTRWLNWVPSGDIDSGSVQVGHDGVYTLISGRGTYYGYLVVNVVYADLPAEDGSYRVQVDNGYQEVLINVAQAESGTGLTTYSCMYLYNTHSTASLLDISLFITYDTFSQSTIAIGVDPIGIGGEPVQLPDSTTPPSGVVFSSPTSDNPLIIGTVPSSQKVPVWIRRTIPMDTTENVVNDMSRISYKVTTQ